MVTGSRNPGAFSGTAVLSKKERVVAAASDLVYRQGIERTTLADLAEVAHVPIGNMYYYFKTKNDIVAAVADAHIQAIEATMADLETRHRSPRARLKALVAGVADQSGLFSQYGCPLGTLCSELAKRPGGPDQITTRLMQALVGWTEEQFAAMGRRDAHDLAVELVIAYQGSAVLASALRDPKVIRGTARRLGRWIDSLGT